MIPVSIPLSQWSYHLRIRSWSSTQGRIGPLEYSVSLIINFFGASIPLNAAKAPGRWMGHALHRQAMYAGIFMRSNLVYGRNLPVVRAIERMGQALEERRILYRVLQSIIQRDIDLNFFFLHQLLH